MAMIKGFQFFLGRLTKDYVCVAILFVLTFGRYLVSVHKNGDSICWNGVLLYLVRRSEFNGDWLCEDRQHSWSVDYALSGSTFGDVAE